MPYTPHQGDIIFMDFSPQAGHEQAGNRPAVIVSNDSFFANTRMAVVCPITNTNNGFPLHIPLDNRTQTTGVIECEHCKTLDIIARNAKYKEALPSDILYTAVSYIKLFF